MHYTEEILTATIYVTFGSLYSYSVEGVVKQGSNHDIAQATGLQCDLYCIV